MDIYIVAIVAIVAVTVVAIVGLICRLPDDTQLSIHSNIMKMFINKKKNR